MLRCEVNENYASHKKLSGVERAFMGTVGR